MESTFDKHNAALVNILINLSYMHVPVFEYTYMYKSSKMPQSCNYMLLFIILPEVNNNFGIFPLDRLIL